MPFLVHLLASAGLAWSLGSAHLGGGLLAFATLYLLARLLGLAVARLRRYAQSLEHGISFCLWFIAQVFLATYHVATLVLARRVEVEPAVLAYPVTRREVDKVTLLGTLLTLTPGTLALEYDEERGLLYIHALDARRSEDVTHILTELERRLLAWLDAGKREGVSP
ncbi:Na+/H+ antiporter subunit E [Ectopseudomonas hydrolytica]|jgi:multicomponent Na+:H+ antiporter subunit E|uniref:Multisubunit sodium/proton antiporter, MrpE subunit n=1 Tax=Ectopseudomonas mendocina (strain ymp) TaxID=399739 RepID=A4XS79_ECTM1|nr:MULTISPECIES: Na+/H+ antiporter subunit E [Pseudomonas]UTH30317.1 Na+/H+ antiporter subunit E [Pseudomonas hydrolytica]UTH35091.1 Na+/H+ antiporter subunit E [Pseudomonas sp. KHPS1]